MLKVLGELTDNFGITEQEKLYKESFSKLDLRKTNGDDELDKVTKYLKTQALQKKHCHIIAVNYSKKVI